MPRRESYTRVVREGFSDQEHVKGMGDVTFKVFQCPNRSCTAWFTVRDDELVDAFDLPCGTCGQVTSSGQVVTIYSYQLQDKASGEILRAADFDILIDDYVAEAPEYKYCIVCANLKPMDAFGRHAARKTNRQGECRQCKNVYNSLKNGTRTVDQHREAAQKRRLYVDIGGKNRIDTTKISDRFEGRCFRCGTTVDASTANVDHTLPAYYLWPVTTETATLLCRDDNGAKGNKWPNEFYQDDKLRILTVKTGISYETLTGPPFFNPKALEDLKDGAKVASMMAKYAKYPVELYNLRNRIFRTTGFDFFKSVPDLASSWIEQADSRLA